jgi:pyruvate/2-oxoglutarate dehydrogenase complex dihydrolipoamide dehydrogenase (E3) component
VAAGRVPNTDSLHLDAAGIATDARGFIRTNERLETNVAGVYGLGDIKGGPAFTHISYDDFRIIRTNVIEKGSTTIADRLVPYTVFIDPQLGRVGMSETEARKSGRAIRVAKMPMNYVGAGAGDGRIAWVHESDCGCEERTAPGCGSAGH